MTMITKIYVELLKIYGRQGWWPINGKYHKGDYSYPRTDSERFEICIGAILTQNTSWKNVEKALKNIEGATAKSLLSMGQKKLAASIRSAGYYNQKAKKLLLFAKFYVQLKGRIPTREQLLDLWGIGPETADSILLYAYNVPSFVVDAYTRRILVAKGIVSKDANYDEIKQLFEKSLRDVREYQECHALLVEHAKSKDFS
jgi:endonuclease III related protein